MNAGWAERGTFVDALEPSDFKELAELGKRRRYPKGSALFGEGSRSDRVLVVMEGRAKISCATEDGKEVLLALRGPGDLLGEMAAFDDVPHSASALALEDMEVLTLPKEAFAEHLETHPAAAITLLRMLSARLRDADEKRVDFASHDAEGRVAKRIVELAERYGEESDAGIRINLPLSQEELGGWLGASREAVSKALQTLRSRGWIETHRRGITVTDLEELRRRAT
jgi:CRP-like cAMP-binding protein